jgi:cation-transporting P-type ATPase 13A2
VTPLSPLNTLQSSYKAVVLLPIQVLEYPYHISSVFPQTIPVDQGTEAVKPSHDYDVRDGMLSHLLIVDYRYTRFAVDPRTGLFHMIRFV